MRKFRVSCEVQRNIQILITVWNGEKEMASTRYELIIETDSNTAHERIFGMIPDLSEGEKAMLRLQMIDACKEAIRIEL